ncbi:hypothetical protein BV25DRAFT_1916108 [Artomyces pyxidatus]|uniref:Uncharacterized protein n=1 Tax=Artomyces pyxidatus TaxID=48021 RepID=A0ACB8T1H9_9AGAM|nr:hypothetical protein BV25DRAFT_1916108 [Artomyces pyxidatus]
MLRLAVDRDAQPTYAPLFPLLFDDDLCYPHDPQSSHCLFAEKNLMPIDQHFSSIQNEPSPLFRLEEQDTEGDGKKLSSHDGPKELWSEGDTVIIEHHDTFSPDLLAAKNIKVRDFAYESKLPPIPSIPHDPDRLPPFPVAAGSSSQIARLQQTSLVSFPDHFPPPPLSDSQESDLLDTPIITPVGSFQWPIADTSDIPTSQLDADFQSMAQLGDTFAPILELTSKSQADCSTASTQARWAQPNSSEFPSPNATCTVATAGLASPRPPRTFTTPHPGRHFPAAPGSPASRYDGAGAKITVDKHTKKQMRDIAGLGSEPNGFNTPLVAR